MATLTDSKIVPARLLEDRADYSMATCTCYTLTASKLDVTKLINSENWAITLISAKGIPLSGHAMIVIEKVDELGVHSVDVAHLKKGGRCGADNDRENIIGAVSVIRNVPDAKLQRWAEEKTETWIVTRDKVESLLGKIEREERGEYPVYFNILGRGTKISLHPTLFDYQGICGDPDDCVSLHSTPPDRISDQNYLISKFDWRTSFEVGYPASKHILKAIPDNCITWAVTKLRRYAKIKLSNDFGTIITTPKGYTDPIEKLDGTDKK